MANKVKSRTEARTMPLIIVAVIIALVAPLFLMPFVYRIAQLFLPEGTLLLTAPLRIVATIIIAVVAYGIAYIPIRFTTKRKKPVFNAVCFVLTALWSIVLAMMWYISL
jgi:hypothetical protein